MTDEPAASADATAAPVSEPAAAAPAPAAVGELSGGKDNKPAAPPAPPADWRDGLSAEHSEYAKRFASPQDVVKGSFDLWKANSSMIRVPGANAKPEDIAKFNKALGAGENTDAYFKAFPGSDGQLAENDKAIRGKVAEVLHKHHVPVAAASELHNVVAEVAQNIQAENERVAKEGRAASEAALRKEWGKDFDGNVQLASRAVQAFGGEELKAFLNSKIVDGVKLGDHPEFIKAFGQVGRRMGEGQFIGAVGGEERASLNDTIDAKTREMKDAQRAGDRQKANKLNHEIMELSGRLYGHEAPVGMSGRTA